MSDQLTERITSALQHAIRYRGRDAFDSQVSAERAYFKAEAESLARGRVIARQNARIHSLKVRVRATKRRPSDGLSRAQVEQIIAKWRNRAGNWLGFLTLRMAPNAQWEIRQFANAVGELVAQAFPRTWELFQGNVR